jgi:hypothetical protein
MKVDSFKNSFCLHITRLLCHSDCVDQVHRGHPGKQPTLACKQPTHSRLQYDAAKEELVKQAAKQAILTQFEES